MPYQSVFRDDLFAGQTVIVTGGGSGIGRCTAHELAALGAHVALVGRTAEKLEAVRAEILQDGGSASTHVCDIRDELAVGTTIDAVLQLRGRLDGLVNNAGGQYRTAMKTISTKGFEAVVRSNLTGGFIFMREAYLRWMEANGGAIVNIIADIWNGWPDFAHSGAARGAWRHCVQRLRHLLARGQGQDTGVSPACAVAALRHRVRSVGGHRVPAFACGGLHHGKLHTGRWWNTECTHHLEPRTASPQQALRGLPPRQPSQTPH